jgi:hypothetical protein
MGIRWHAARYTHASAAPPSHPWTQEASVIIPRYLAALIALAAIAASAPAPAAQQEAHTARERPPCSRCNDRDCMQLAALELGLRQPCLPASARSRLRPRTHTAGDRP